MIKSAAGNLASFAKSKEEQILYRVIENRGIEDQDALRRFLNPSLNFMYSPESLKGIEEATELLLDAIDESQKIRIVGDYDVDGIMSTYILYKFIKNENENIDYVIPHRIADGYGINTSIVQDAIDDKVELILTCDNGISAFDALELAKTHGVKVIVLDHHEPKIDDKTFMQVLPAASAIVNPKQDDCNYPFKGLCGAAICYKFIDFVAAHMGYEEGEIVRDYLEFAALATICDVMELVDENRIIVYNGLELLNNTVNVGLKTLIKTAEIDNKKIEPYHVGFIIGPMLNASGRLDTALKSLQLLLETNVGKAQGIALELKKLNEERSKLTKEGLNLVIKNIESSSIMDDKIIVAYEPSIHESIAGIIAGKVKERYNKPTIVLTDGEEFAKGSARSIQEFDITNGISKQGSLLKSFGGHRLAAGLSLDKENIDEFRVNINAESELTDEDLIRKVYIDLGMPISHISQVLIDDLDKIQPYGNGNPRPLFGAKGVRLSGLKLLGANKNVLKMVVTNEETQYDGIYFGDIDNFNRDLQELNTNLEEVLLNNTVLNADIVYQINLNEWNNKKTIQLTLTNYRLNER